MSDAKRETRNAAGNELSPRGYAPLSENGEVLSEIAVGAPYDREAGEHALPQTPARSSNEAMPLINDCLRQLVERPAQANGVVLSIYGGAGEGKSEVVGRLYTNPDSWGGNDATCILVDFYGCDGNVDDCLARIKQALLSKGLICPRYTLASNRLAYGERTDVFYRALEDECASTGVFRTQNKLRDMGLGEYVDALSAYLDLAGMIPVLGAAAATTRLTKKVVAQAKAAHIKDDIGEEWNAMCRLDRRILEHKLPEYLLKDLKAIQGYDQKHKLVVLVDTFEHAWHRGSDGFSRPVWMERLSKVNNTVWVISGRQSVRWHNVIQFPLELVDFSKEESIDYLARGGIEDKGLALKLYAVTKGVPLFLEMCVAIAARLGVMADANFTLADLAEETYGPQDVLDRYLHVLDDDLRACAYAAAYLREWDEGELAEVLVRACGVENDRALLAARDFVHVSFVRPGTDGYKVHEAVGELIRGFEPPDRAGKVRYSQMFTELGTMAALAAGDSELPRSIRDARVLKYHRAMVDLTKSMHISKDCDELIDLGEGYVRELRLAGKTAEAWSRACDLVESCGDLNGTGRYVTLNLLKAAVQSDLFRATGDFSYHEHALEIERRALVAAQQAGDEGLIARARNAVGVSLGRFDKSVRSKKDFLEELSLLEPNYLASLQVPLDRRNQWDGKYLTNYGAACQHYATDWLETHGTDGERDDFLREAEKAYREAVSTRELVLGKNASDTLTVLINLGVVLYRLNVFNESGCVLDDVSDRLADGDYAEDNAIRLRNDYHRAILLELEGDAAGGNLRTEKLEEALELHKHVLCLREDSLGIDAIDTHKSAEAVARCEAALGIE